MVIMPTHIHIPGHRKERKSSCGSRHELVSRLKKERKKEGRSGESPAEPSQLKRRPEREREKGRRSRSEVKWKMGFAADQSVISKKKKAKNTEIVRSEKI